jgi:N,N-dimethylformamidase beta subunit-like, C-terminal
VRSFAVTATLGVTLAATLGSADSPPDGHVRTDTRLVPAVEAAFRRESYRPGQRARLVVRDSSRTLTVQVLRAGPELETTESDTDLNGVPVTPVKTIHRQPGRQPLSVPIGRWPSGLYFTRLEAPDGRVGFAPFVLAPHGRRARVAVVLPTLTWQAYNFRDDDGDGRPDSWYAGKRLNTVRLGRAFLDRGVPYGLRFHLGFLHWLSWTGKRADVLSQWDLEHVSSGRALRRAYDLLVFAGHHEYVTTREYDLVERYRNRGGNLMFLCSNSYYWRVARNGGVIEKTGRWRNLGRPEASLLGAQYIAYQRTPRRPWVARRTPAARWFLRGTGLRPGSRFGRGGVEIDHVVKASPRHLQVLAEIPNLFGRGRTAQMTYYETNAGARVFAAGAFHFTRAITTDFVVWQLLENVWARLTR